MGFFGYKGNFLTPCKVVARQLSSILIVHQHRIRYLADRRSDGVLMILLLSQTKQQALQHLYLINPNVGFKFRSFRLGHRKL